MDVNYEQDVDTWLSSEIEKAIPCERPARAGSNRDPSACKGTGTAAWVFWVVHPACAASPYYLYCDACRDMLLSQYTTVVCEGCLETFSPAAKAYSLIEALSRP